MMISFMSILVQFAYALFEGVFLYFLSIFLCLVVLDIVQKYAKKIYEMTSNRAYANWTKMDIQIS